jgi:hypothetical protein
MAAESKKGIRPKYLTPCFFGRQHPDLNRRITVFAKKIVTALLALLQLEIMIEKKEYYHPRNFLLMMAGSGQQNLNGVK